MFALFTSWIILLIIKTILCGIMSVEESTILILVLHKISVIVGVISMWIVMDYVMKNKSFVEKILKLTPHTFFIFCFHEPLLDFVIQYSIMNIGNTTLFNVITFFIYPVLTIIVAILVSELMIKYIPALHNILTGSRGTRKINFVK